MLRITFSQINQNYSYITNKQTNKHKLVTQFLLLFYLVNITLLYSETPREAYIKTKNQPSYQQTKQYAIQRAYAQ